MRVLVALVSARLAAALSGLACVYVYLSSSIKSAERAPSYVKACAREATNHCDPSTAGTQWQRREVESPGTDLLPGIAGEARPGSADQYGGKL